MQPQSVVAGLIAREGLVYFLFPPPAGHGLNLYRRYAFAALGPAKAERLLREVCTGAAGPGEPPRD